MADEDVGIVVDTGVSVDGVATDVVISVDAGVDIEVDAEDDDDDDCDGRKWYSSKLPRLPNMPFLAAFPPPGVMLNPRLLLEMDFFACVNLC